MTLGKRTINKELLDQLESNLMFLEHKFPKGHYEINLTKAPIRRVNLGKSIIEDRTRSNYNEDEVAGRTAGSDRYDDGRPCGNED